MPPLFMFLSPTPCIIGFLREDTMNTKPVFAPAESEDICFAPPILTFVPQKSQPQTAAPLLSTPQTPVAGTPVR